MNELAVSPEVSRCLDYEKFNNLFRLDVDTGKLHWKVRRRGVNLSGIAGVRDPRGYWKVRVDGVQYYRSHIVWLLTTGNWPIHTIDHINRLEGDDRPINLRDVPFRTNARNRGVYSNNTTGHPGICELPSGKWRAIRNGDRLGHYPAKEEAIAAYNAAE